MVIPWLSHAVPGGFPTPQRRSARRLVQLGPDQAKVHSLAPLALEPPGPPGWRMCSNPPSPQFSSAVFKTIRSENRIPHGIPTG